jgi:lipopolysaccharide/colanic/teichoic acid biosynthesis glycosyltransferase
MTVKTFSPPADAAREILFGAHHVAPHARSDAASETRERLDQVQDISVVLPPQGFCYRPKKVHALARRLLDVTVALVALLASSPVIVAAALLIKLEDGGPIFFTQRRVGRFGKLFSIYKLRTMRVNVCADALKPSSSGDARITAVGRYLRKLSIDELPQLINVLRGDMGIVGPRPEMPFLVRQYQPWQHLRHLETPGITGLWQVTSRKTIPLQHPKATALDLEYIATGSPVRDLFLILRTFGSLLSTRGVH